MDEVESKGQLVKYSTSMKQKRAFGRPQLHRQHRSHKVGVAHAGFTSPSCTGLGISYGSIKVHGIEGNVDVVGVGEIVGG